MKIGRNKVRVASVGLTIIALLSMFQDQLCIKVDAAVILVLCLAMVLFIVPDLSLISKLKFGDVEMEFKDELDKVEQMIESEEQTLTTTTQTPLPINGDNNVGRNFYDEYKEVYNSSSSNLEKALRASQLVEQMILTTGEKMLAITKDGVSPYRIIKKLVEYGRLSSRELLIYEEYTQLRNKIIHGDGRQLDDSSSVRFLDLSYRIIKIFHLRF